MPASSNVASASEAPITPVPCQEIRASNAVVQTAAEQQATRHVVSVRAGRGRSRELGEIAETFSREKAELAPTWYPADTIKAEGSPFFFADCDEAGHSLSKIGEGLVSNTKGDEANPVRQVRESIAALQKNDVGWIQNSVLVQGPVDFAVSAALSLPIIPLAILASKSGEAEMHRAAREIKELKKEIPSVEHGISLLANVIDASAVAALTGPPLTDPPLTDSLLPSSGVAMDEKGIGKFGTEIFRFAKVKLVGQKDRLEKLEYLKKQNGADEKIGRFAMCSGNAMLLKTGELGVKTAQMAVGGNVFITAAAGFVGALNVAVLNLATAIPAVYLGAQFTKKSAAQLKVCKQENRLATERMAKVDKATAEINSYIRFQKEKGAHIEKFRTWFARLNKGFLVGAGLYAAAAIGGALAVGLVVAGAMPFAVVAVIAIAVIAPIAGLIMAIGSPQFFTGHPRQARYQENLRHPDVELDGHRLAALDLLRQPHDGGADREEFHLRAGFYSQISERERLRQNLLADTVGKSTNKPYYGKRVHISDNLPDGTPAPRQTRWKTFTAFTHHTAGNIGGRFEALASFAKVAVNSGSLSDAKKAARSAWNESRDYLTKTHLKSWLNKPENKEELIEFLKKITQQQLNYFAERLQTEVAITDSLASELGALAATQVRGEKPIAPAWSHPGRAAFLMANEASVEAEDEDRQCRIEAKKILLENRQSIDFVLAGIVQNQKILETFDDLLAEMEWLKTNPSGMNGDSAFDLTKIAENSNGNFSRAIDHCVALQSGIAHHWNRDATLETSLGKFAGFLMDAAPLRYRKMRGNLYEGGLESARQLNQWNLLQVEA